MPQENTKPVLLSDVYPDYIPVIPLENRPVFPGITIPLTFTGKRFIDTITKSIENHEGFLGLVLVKKANSRDFFASDLYHVGTLVKIIKVIQQTENSIQMFAQSLQRFELVRESRKTDTTSWEIKYLYDQKPEKNDELKAAIMAIMAMVKELIQINPFFQEQMKIALSQMGHENPGMLMDIIASLLTSEKEKLQELLEATDLYHRSEKLLILIKEEQELSALQEKIQKQIEEKVNKQQKEYFLREQLKVIKKELGLEKDDKATEIEKIEKRVQSLKLSEEAATVIREELEKLKILDPGSSEFHVTRTYLNVLTELPWGIFSGKVKDIQKARLILDKQHYGLEDVKKRILEFISTIIKRGKVSGSIICLVGPPGVGKTSVGRSIAEALGRKFYRFSVGGMRDEAEIKGHRRTYIGAMPGKIIQSLKRTGTSNPVIMLDEIDKIGISYQGDPASSLLEVLDPEQNSDFLDHYLDVRYDLSNVLFITTANQLDTIPRPLLDRMEIIKLPGYIPQEKVEIAKRYLIPKQREAHGLSKKDITITEGAIRLMTEKYAREAGVRNLENQIKKIMRQVTYYLVEGSDKKITVNTGNLETFLGKPVFSDEELYENLVPGVVPGLAWTTLGGTILYIEATAIPAKSGGFKQTGQLGNVMQESSEIAYTYVRSLLSDKKEMLEFFENRFIHLHVPEGATPKDGPSAGITMALALYSLATGTTIKPALAMTGELTLTGKVLPIGGVREKTIAAKRAGIRELVFPHANRKDFEELPDYVRKGLTPHYVNSFREVLKVAEPD
ncbi:MAG: endopeptidase La [Chlorobi bacterium]|nr:endopeptidase La [Chlorobiota bacterium]